VDSGARGSTDGRPNAASADDACSSSVQQCALESSYYSSSALSSRHAAPPGRLQSRAPPVAGPRVPLPAGSPGQCLHTASAQCPVPLLLAGWLAACCLPLQWSMSPEISRSVREPKIAPGGHTDDRKRYGDDAGRHGG
jgi:hypothetical protein